MSTTTSAYLSVSRNLARYQQMEAAQPAVKNAAAYYKAHIGTVKTIGQFVSNYRLLSYALQAYGLGDQVNNRALITKVLQQGVTSPHALANTLPNAGWKKFAAAFNFSATGDAAPSSSASVATTVGDYNEEQVETDQGADNVGVQLALYFKRVAPTIKDGLSIMADKNLLQVAQTIFNLPPTANADSIDREAKQIEKLMPVADLKDPKKLERLVERFTGQYDVKYGPGSSATTQLTATGANGTTAPSAAATILSGIASSNSQLLESMNPFAPLISPSLLANLSLGG